MSTIPLFQCGCLFFNVTSAGAGRREGDEDCSHLLARVLEVGATEAFDWVELHPQASPGEATAPSGMYEG